MERVINLKLKLQKAGQKGLALDVDETLSWTIHYWMEQMQQRFGNPENLSVEAMIAKYRYAQHVPYWQGEEVETWLEKMRHSDEMQEDLMLVKGADLAVAEINKIIPIKAYITARPETVEKGTIKWLRANNFPEADVITKPVGIPYTEGNRWKAGVLTMLHPQILGIVDDNVNLIRYLPDSYRGRVFLFDNPKEAGDGQRFLAGKTWPEIIGHINTFSASSMVY